MPVGKHLINQVASVLSDKPIDAHQIRASLVAIYSSRAIRYAIKNLVDNKKARRRSLGQYRMGYIAWSQEQQNELEASRLGKGLK